MLVLLLAASAMVARPPIGRASVLRSSMTALRKVPAHQRRARPEMFAEPLFSLASAAPESLTAWDPTGIAKWGWWVVIGYMFAAQAKVCDEFFVPAIEACSRKFSIPEDVAGATLMAFGCNGPELGVNAVSIFVTHSDMGVGTIIGSEIFNLLCIIGGATLVAPIAPLPVEKGPFARDCAFYAVAAVLLGVVVMDGEVSKPEATALVFMAGLYAFAVSQTATWLENAGFRRCITPRQPSEGSTSDILDGDLNEEGEACVVVCGVPVSAEVAAATDFVCVLPEDDPPPDESGPKAVLSAVLSQAGKALDFSLGPFEHILEMTVPDCRPATAESDEKWLPAFAASMFWLAVCSLAVCLTADQLTVDFGIPSAVVGLTVAAAGTSFANLLSSLIEARRGRVGMAVANALGSNVQNVFLALGIPWLAYTLLSGGAPLQVTATGIVLVAFGLQVEGAFKELLFIKK